MKKLTNILSYLCLLLLLLVVACSDLEEITIGMLSDEEVELTIPTAIPSLGGSTRTAPAEDITSITALAFDSDHELVKVVKATLPLPDKITTSTINGVNYSTKGTMTIKVPARTRRIHFIAKNGGDFEAITPDDYGRKDTDLLVDLTSDELHYWAMLEFESAADMQSLEDELGAAPNTEGRLTLVRNMAKIALDAGEGSYIAGILNYNVKGTIVPYKKDANDVYQFGYERNGTNHDLPSVFQITSDTEDRQLGTEHYMFEEFNDVGDLVYIICKIGTLYYKVAFVNPNADSSSSTKYYYIVRNRAYKIRIDGTLDTKFGRDSYESAVRDAKPINDTANEQVHIEFDQDVLYMFLDETATVKVTIPDGITTLKVGYFDDYFDQKSEENGIKTTVSPTAQETETVNVDGDDKVLWVDTYTVTGGTELEFTIKLREGFEHAIKDIQVQFLGDGEGKTSNDKLTIHALERGTLQNITPKAVQILKTAGSQFTATVTIPSYTEDVGNFELWVGTADGAFAVTPPENLRLLDDGYYDVAEGQTYTFTFTLNEDGTAGEVKTVTYYIVTDFHRLIGTTEVTLLDVNVTERDEYAIWVNNDNNTWTGTPDAVDFFGYKTTAEGSFAIGNTPNGFRTEFYDTGANDHKQQAMVMGSDDSFTFTIPAGESRWLTMLVAADGSNTPSIKLMQGETEWTTSAAAEATTVPANYNFGNGEIGTAGRLIRYELPAGTYTLQGSSAEYLLYYMRVTKAKPVMTDVAQPRLTDYTLSWSGATYTNTDATGHLPIGDDNRKHIVDENNLTHTVVLKNENNSLNTLLNLNLSTFALAGIDLVVETTRVAFTATNENTYNTTTTTQEISAQSNSCELTTYNAGNYALSGTINEPDYKYEAFYDKLHLDAVPYEVKSPIMPGLYTSMDGDKLTPVNGFTSLDEVWAIGFKLPMVIPDLNVTPDNYSIGINIPDWTKSGDGDATGLGVIVGENGNYTLGNQDDMIHPREGWTYKIKWASIPDAKMIVPSLTGDKGDETKDTDHYFIYDGTIAKSVEIATPYTEQQLGVTLNFRSASENKGNGETYNLNFGNDFYLTAQISQEDAQNYAGKMVRLQGSFSNTQGGGNGAINWNNSRMDDSTIEYGKNDGTVLQFEIKQGQTSYEIHWQFVRSNNETGEVRFTYTIGGQNVSGENSVTLNFAGSQTPDNTPFNVTLDFYTSDSELDGNGTYTNSNLVFGETELYLKATVPDNVPEGTTIVLKRAIGGEPNAIHQYYSHNTSKSNGLNESWTEQMSFTTVAEQKEYWTCWKFVRSDNTNQGAVNITYALTSSDESKYTLSGETNANITIIGNHPKQIKVSVDGTSVGRANTSLEYTKGGNDQLTVQVTVPDGVGVLNIEADDFNVALANANAANGQLANNKDFTFNSNQGERTVDFILTLKEGSKAPKNESLINFAYAENRWTVAPGVVVVRLSEKVVDDGVIFDLNFNSSNEGFYYKGEDGGSVSASEGALVLNNTEVRANAWDAQAMIATDKMVYEGTYTLTFKAKIEDEKTTGGLIVAIQHIVNDDTNYTYFYSGNENVQTYIDNNKNSEGWAQFSYDITIRDINNQETPNTNNPTHFMFNFGKLKGEILIDDLKLVEKTN